MKILLSILAAPMESTNRAVGAHSASMLLPETDVNTVGILNSIAVYGKVWLIRLLWEQKTLGSNPSRPTVAIVFNGLAQRVVDSPVRVRIPLVTLVLVG